MIAVENWTENTVYKYRDFGIHIHVSHASSRPGLNVQGMWINVQLQFPYFKEEVKLFSS